MSIVIPEDKIKRRLQSSTKLIQKFSRTINCIRDSTQPQDFIVLGSSSTSKGNDYFKIKEGKINKSTFFGSYKEVWKPRPDGTFILLKMYFQLSIIIDHKHEELLALHCDLDSDPNKPNQRYKIHPHLHVSSSKFDFISKAHFSLCLLSHKTVINKLENLESLYRDFFDMIIYEIIK